MKTPTTKQAYSVMRLLTTAAFTVAGLIAISGPAQGSAMVPPPAAISTGIVVLDSGNTAGTLTLSGNGEIKCPVVYVNSSSNSAVRGSGSAMLDTPMLDVVGNVNLSGHSACTGTINAGFPGPAMDPDAGLAVPAADPSHDLGTLSITGTRTVNPGYYSGGISASTANANVTFNPGVYVLGNGLTISDGTIAGSGVCFVILGGRVTLSGNGSATLTAPTSGNLAGVLIAQPASNTGAMALSGGSGMSIQGTISAPGSAATVSGNGTVTGQGPMMGDMLIVKKLTLSGTGLVTVGHPLPQRTVVAPQLTGQYD